MNTLDLGDALSDVTRPPDTEPSLKADRKMAARLIQIRPTLTGFDPTLSGPPLPEKLVGMVNS